MTDARLKSRWLRAGPAIAITALLIAGVGAGCGGDEETPANPNPDTGTDSPGEVAETTPPPTEGGTDGDTAPDTGPLGDGTIGTVKTATAKISAPFDATPDTLAEKIYFTAVGANGPSVFRVDMGSAADPTELVTAPSPFAAPFGIAISTDGKTLYIADPAAPTASDTGGIYSLAITGSAAAPALVTGTEGYNARALEVNATDIYFSGNDKADGAPGLFKVPTGGGAVTVVAKGAPFVDPSGVTLAKSGDAYVLDTVGAPSRLAVIIKVSGATATKVVGDVNIGYPGGLALSQDDSALLVSGIDPAKGTDVIWRVTLGADPTPKPITVGDIVKGIDAAGMHRAKGADIYAWADSKLDGGTVFALSK